MWRQAVPTAATRERAAEWAQPLLQLFPGPSSAIAGGATGSWTGRTTRPAHLDTGGIRIDQSLGSRLTLFGRYNDSPSSNQFGTLTVNQLDLRSRSHTLGANLRITPHLLMDFRLNHSQAEADSLWRAQPDCLLSPVITEFLRAEVPCDYLVRFSIGGVGQIVSGREGARRQRQWQFTQSGLMAARRPHADVRRGLSRHSRGAAGPLRRPQPHRRQRRGTRRPTHSVDRPIARAVRDRERAGAVAVGDGHVANRAALHAVGGTALGIQSGTAAGFAGLFSRPGKRAHLRDPPGAVAHAVSQFRAADRRRAATDSRWPHGAARRAEACTTTPA